MDLASVLLTGLLAGGASCAAVQGGLLAGVVARRDHDRDRTPRPVGSPAPTSDPGTSTTGRVAAAQPVQTLRGDLRPVAAFLAGKLASHTALGAVLGFAGSLALVDYRVRAYSQLAAGVLMSLLALAQLGVPGFARFVVSPPRPLARLLRRTTKSRANTAPALLGAATVLIPCGVTLSVEALAAASGSAAAGAAIMATFVVGTSPLFAVIGYAARRTATALGGQLARLTALVVLGMGLVTLNAGLVLVGSPVTSGTIAAVLRTGPATPAVSRASAAGGTGSTSTPGPLTLAGGRQTIVINATDTAYHPSTIRARAGLPTTLVVRTNHTLGCTREIIIRDLGISKILPETGDTSLDLGTLQPGHLEYTCGMGMSRGSITAA